MTKLEQAILRTLCYADIFDYPLNQTEIYRFFIWQHKETPPQQKKLVSTLFNLTKKSIIAHAQGYFFLPKRQSLVNLRKSRKQISTQKISHATSAISHNFQDPNIQGVFLTGNLAMKNADKSDDIDIMIITKAHSLWTTRLKLTLSLQLKGLRRTPTSTDHTNLLCTNMYLDVTVLAIPKQKQNLYTAHEVAQVTPIINRDDIFDRFLTANSWITDYLPNIKIPANPIRHSGLDPESTSSKPSALEKLAYQLQLQYMKPKITNETISPHLAFFHPRNTSHEVMKTYRTLVKNALGQLE